MTGSEVEVVRPGAVAALGDTVLSEEQVDLIKRTIAKGTTNDELALFIRQCDRTQLDPFSGQIHCLGIWDAELKRKVFRPSPSISGMILVADRTGEFAGFTSMFWCGPDGVWVDVWLNEEEPPVAAKIGVYRRGHAEVHWGVAHYREFVGTKQNGDPNKMWKEKPAHMTGKCAKAIALRDAFPHELSGLYIREELHDDIPERSDPNRAAGDAPPPSQRVLSAPRRRDRAPRPAATDPGDIEDAETVPSPSPASESAEVAEVAEPDPDGRVTPDQMRTLLDLFRENGLGDNTPEMASARKQYICDVLEHDVEKASDMTVADAEKVAAMLRSEIERDKATEAAEEAPQTPPAPAGPAEVRGDPSSATTPSPSPGQEGEVPAPAALFDEFDDSPFD